jgi:hypothetical protein
MKRLSFVFEGIYGKDKGLGGVWANNQITNANILCPLCFINVHMNKYEYLKRIYNLDVWRIDTTLIDNTWHIDPNMINDSKFYGANAEDYLYCEESVHPRALKLFTINVRNLHYLQYLEANIDFRLTPVNQINRIIHDKWHSKRFI